MILWKRLTISFLSFLALANLRPHWKNDMFVSLPFDAKFHPITTMALVDDNNAMDVAYVDFPSLDLVHSGQGSSGGQVGEAKWAEASNASKIGNSSNAVKPVKTRSFPISVEAIHSPTLIVSPMPANPKLYFIHVGKAGGLTLNLILDTEGKWKSLPCLMERSKQNDSNPTPLLQGHANVSNATASSLPCYLTPAQYPSQLSQHLVSHLHLFGSRFSKEQRAWILDHTDTFLFLLRDPIDRIVSAYNFHRHNFANTTKPGRKMFYQVCFPNGMEDLVNQLSHHYDHEPNTTQCPSIGIRALKGGKRGSGAGNHFDYNYGYYASKTIDLKPDHAVVVIRTEYMWDDIIALDQALGGAGDFSNVGTKVSHGSETWKGTEKYNAYLSSDNLKLLCCFLFEELEVYHRLILLADNLNAGQKQVTLSSTFDHCQIVYSGDPVSQPFPWDLYYNTTCLPMIQESVLPVAV